MDRLNIIKKNQKFNLIIGIVFLVLAIAMVVLDVLNLLNPIDSSFIALLVGGSIGALSSYLRVRNIFKDEKKAEEYINNEFDERNLTIYLHSARSTLRIVGYLGILVACVFAYINKIVFLTIMWTLVAGLVIYLICYSYYKKKY